MLRGVIGWKRSFMKKTSSSLMLLCFFCLLFICCNSTQLNILKYADEYDIKTRENYSFYKEARIQYLDLKSDMNAYMQIIDVLKVETKVTNIGLYNFNLLRHFFITPTETVINNYYSVKFQEQYIFCKRQ